MTPALPIIPDTAPAPGETSEVADIRKEDHTLARLYAFATELETDLERYMRDVSAVLTAPQIGRFNQILREARTLLPESKTLVVAADEIDAGTAPRDAWHVMHVEIVPTLHNALPAADYEKTG